MVLELYLAGSAKALSEFRKFDCRLDEDVELIRGGVCNIPNRYQLRSIWALYKHKQITNVYQFTRIFGPTRGGLWVRYAFSYGHGCYTNPAEMEKTHSLIWIVSLCGRLGNIKKSDSLLKVKKWIRSEK